MPPPPSLGALISEHRCTRTLTVLAVVAGPLLLLMGVGLVAALFLFPEPDRPLAATVIIATFGVGACALGVLVLVFWRRKYNTRIVLYEGGIVELVRQKRRELSWQAIASFDYRTIATGTYEVTQLTIVPNDGKRFRLNSQHVQGLDAIAAKLASEVTAVTLPGMRERLAAGERVGFGKLTLSREGVHKKQRLLPWSEVADVWVHAGFLRVLRHGDAVAGLVVSAAGLERIDALLVLIRENCQRAPADTPLTASRSFRQVVPRLVVQTMLGMPLAALFFGIAGYNLWRAFRSLHVIARHHDSVPMSPWGWALITGAIGVFLAAGYYYDLTRHIRQHRLARRLAKDGKLVPVMVLENKFEQWSFHSGWRYRYLTPYGFEAVDRIDVGLGGAATWSTDGAYLLALCSPDERESVLITMSGYPLTQRPAPYKTDEASRP
jgi:hypothetical protein